MASESPACAGRASETPRRVNSVPVDAAEQTTLVRVPRPRLAPAVEGAVRGPEDFPLEGPLAWVGDEPWPPTVEEARALLAASRNRKRNPARHLTYASALAYAGWAEDDVRLLAQGYQHFIEIATEGGEPYDRYRALAIQNAVVTLDAIPYDLARRLAGELMLAAMQAIEGAMLEGLRVRVRRLVQRLEEQEHDLAVMRWAKRGCRLVFEEPSGREHLGYVPVIGFSGSWVGVGHALAQQAFIQIPESCHVPEPLRLLPDRTGLAVECL